MLVVAGEVEVKDTYIRPFTSMWCIGWDCKTYLPEQEDESTGIAEFGKSVTS